MGVNPSRTSVRLQRAMLKSILRSLLFIFIVADGLAQGRSPENKPGANPTSLESLDPEFEATSEELIGLPKLVHLDG